jgi:hypothetical protein
LRRLPGGEGGEREIVEVVEVVPEELERNSPERGEGGGDRRQAAGTKATATTMTVLQATKGREEPT